MMRSPDGMYEADPADRDGMARLIEAAHGIGVDFCAQVGGRRYCYDVTRYSAGWVVHRLEEDPRGRPATWTGGTTGTPQEIARYVCTDVARLLLGTQEAMRWGGVPWGPAFDVGGVTFHDLRVPRPSEAALEQAGLVVEGLAEGDVAEAWRAAGGSGQAPMLYVTEDDWTVALPSVTYETHAESHDNVYVRRLPTTAVSRLGDVRAAVDAYGRWLEGHDELLADWVGERMHAEVGYGLARLDRLSLHEVLELAGDRVDANLCDLAQRDRAISDHELAALQRVNTRDLASVTASLLKTSERVCCDMPLADVASAAFAQERQAESVVLSLPAGRVREVMGDGVSEADARRVVDEIGDWTSEYLEADAIDTAIREAADDLGIAPQEPQQEALESRPRDLMTAAGNQGKGVQARGKKGKRHRGVTR